MDDKGLTTMNLKKINKAKVYQYIYQKKQTSKLQIVQQLQMGLSTVSQNLTLLEQEGLIARNGSFDSTGGRRAQVIEIVPDVRLSIGVGILKDRLHITAVDLYGSAVHRQTVPLSYSGCDGYYGQAARYIQKFIQENQIADEKILGVSFATQGIISPDQTTVTYGKILGNTGMQVSDLSRHLPYACHLEHDSKAAACLELWNHPELNSAIVFLLNPNLGGAVICDRTIHHGISMHSGVIEHMCINPDGPMCYCGNRGCLETYCSASALEQAAGLPAKAFFPLLRQGGDPRLPQIWQDYLQHLAFAMRNVNMVMDAPIILSGYLAPYLEQEDVNFLLEKINGSSPFALERSQILTGTHGAYAPAMGAALYFVERFLGTI